MASRIWQRGVTASHTCDAGARLTGIDYSHSTPDVTFACLSTGQVNTRADGAGTTTFSYAADGRARWNRPREAARAEGEKAEKQKG